VIFLTIITKVGSNDDKNIKLNLRLGFRILVQINHRKICYRLFIVHNSNTPFKLSSIVHFNLLYEFTK
jgi:hypothetical protein